MSTAFRVFVPFAIGYFFSYAFRNVNAVIAPDLAADLALSPASLGLLTSAYFLAFASFQLPLGVLLDRYGPRRVGSTLLVVAALGAFAFASGHGLATLALARGVIGLGVSACLMGSFKAYVMWFPGERLPLLNGCTMAVGGLGALTVTAPVQALLAWTDWRGVFELLGTATLVAAAALFLVVPRRPEEHAEAPREPLADQIAGVRRVFASRLFWRVAPLTLAAQSAFLSFQGLWAGPWLRDVSGLDRAGVADTLMLIPLAMVIGFASIGIIAERLGRRGVRTVAVAAVGFAGFFLIQLALALGAPVPPPLAWFAFALFGTTTSLNYAVLSRGFPRALAGRVNTGMNLIAFSGAFAAQWGVGVLIGLFPAAHAGAYARAGYATGMGVVLVAEVLAFAWMFWPRRDPALHLT